MRACDREEGEGCPSPRSMCGGSHNAYSTASTPVSAAGTAATSAPSTHYFVKTPLHKTLNEQERGLIDACRHCSPAGRQRIVEYAHMWLKE